MAKLNLVWLLNIYLNLMKIMSYNFISILITGFLYQTEIQNWFETGVLTKVNTAFSRDQEEKIYVQHKMLQHGAEFFEWLQAGSYVYVCGAKQPMSIDVEQTLLKIIEQFGERSKDEAEQYLDTLKEEGRYITDVY